MNISASTMSMQVYSLAQSLRTVELQKDMFMTERFTL